jgi:hypothetical protein
MVELGVVVHASDPSTRRQRQKDLCKFKASLGLQSESRTARAVIPRNPVSKKKKKDQNYKPTGGGLISDPWQPGFYVTQLLCPI